MTPASVEVVNQRQAWVNLYVLTARVSKEKRFSEAVLRLNSASEKRASCSKKIKLIYSVNGEMSKEKRFSEAVLRLNSASEKRASCSKKIKLIYSVNGESVRRKSDFRKLCCD
ncbi:hypothetical protein TNCV_5086041 [Trichonephila clavipes]|uniref:Uncharacterized protein n=1 Tax=Trichonephila clavipes TaxID=2585209 RepID=A0A8X6VHD9_TRICX|nr:hypothetical protein TNCV_5086041 [Trichonephila clavipes]